ncbi:hypothetical protein HMI55_004357 [Coelomomyces lativittatus]|nr:hypothetical protein HMI55_004357 [Coelomomyces lativittatus]
MLVNREQNLELSLDRERKEKNRLHRHLDPKSHKNFTTVLHPPLIRMIPKVSFRKVHTPVMNTIEQVIILFPPHPPFS